MGELLEDRLRHPAPPAERHHEPVGLKRLDEFGGDISHFRVVKLMPSRLRQIAVAKTEPGDENNQDISSLVGKVDIRKLETACAERSGRLQLLRRAEPGQPGHARVRRDVQGADQDAAPAADRDAGRQLHRHRGYRRHPVRRHHPGPLQRGGVADLQEQPQQRGLPRPHLHRQGAVLPAGDRGEQDLREAAGALRAGRGPLRAGHAGDAGPLLRAVAAEGARELHAVRQDARLRRREPEGDRPARAQPAGIPDAAGVDEGMDGAPPASPSRSWPRRSTTTPPRWRPTRCT